LGSLTPEGNARAYPRLVAETAVIDRFEEELAVLEASDGAVVIPVADLPEGAKPGDHLRVHVWEDGSVSFELDAVATRRAFLENQAGLDELNAGDPGGDIQS
jgi:hypothetical protein